MGTTCGSDLHSWHAYLPTRAAEELVPIARPRWLAGNNSLVQPYAPVMRVSQEVRLWA